MMKSLLLVNGKARINNVMTRPKSTYIQFRVSDDVKRELQIVAELRGLSMSGLIHSFIVKAIREEKEADPQAFKRGIPMTTLKVKREDEIKKRKSG